MINLAPILAPLFGPKFVKILQSWHLENIDFASDINQKSASPSSKVASRNGVEKVCEN